MEESYSTENLISKDFSKILPEESDVSSFISLKDSRFIYEEKKSEFPLIGSGYGSRNSLETIPSKFHYPNFHEQFGDINCNSHSSLEKNTFHANTMQPVNAGLGTGIGKLKERLNKIDEKVERIGFGIFQKQNNRSNKQTDLYYEWFAQNYIIEEMKSRSESAVDIDGNACSTLEFSEKVPANNSENFSDEDTSDEYLKNIFLEYENGLDSANTEDSYYQWFEKKYITKEINPRSKSIVHNDGYESSNTNCSEKFLANDSGNFTIEDNFDKYTAIEGEGVLDIANTKYSFQEQVCPLKYPKKRYDNASSSVNFPFKLNISDKYSKAAATEDEDILDAANNEDNFQIQVCLLKSYRKNYINSSLCANLQSRFNNSDEYTKIATIQDEDVLDITNTNDSFQYLCPIKSSEKQYVNSSLDVLLSTISPKSDTFSESVRFQEKSESFREGGNLKLLTRNIEILKEILKFLDEKEKYYGDLGRHEDYKLNKSRNGKKDLIKSTSIVGGQRSKRKQKEHDILENVKEMYYENADMTIQKTNLVVFNYRIICLKFERAIIRPYANVLADSYALISFTLFLFAFVFFFIFDRIHFLISNQRNLNFENTSGNSGEKQSTVKNSEEPTTSSVHSDKMLSCENAFSGETVVAKLILNKNRNIEKCLDINSWIKVEAEKVDIVSMNSDNVTKNLINCNKNTEHSLTAVKNITVFCSEELHRDGIKPNSNVNSDFELINDNPNEERELLLKENDFDMEVIASSEMLCSHEPDDREIYYSNDAGKCLKQCGACSGSIIKSNSNSFLPFENSFIKENILFNSTDIE